MVTVVLEPKVAPTGLLNVTENVLADTGPACVTIGIKMLLLVPSPAAHVSVPLDAA